MKCLPGSILDPEIATVGVVVATLGFDAVGAVVVLEPVQPLPNGAAVAVAAEPTPTLVAAAAVVAGAASSAVAPFSS